MLWKPKNGRTAEKPHKNGKSETSREKSDEKLYRPADKEPFMNERQREYFRVKLLDWREDILKEAKDTLQHLQDESKIIPTWPIVHHRRPTGRSSCAPATASAS